ncbi:hypothetical protein NUW58_g10027 [Xylaria curta]|uniref:Uncharacterized protein n=1 Tax=Xylaria curta TaxID=42375 RepID=A0ACC1MRP0_9PEZI|nr:hypothetical protein NUW58_g10027 [Xylaria curta]
MRHPRYLSRCRPVEQQATPPLLDQPGTSLVPKSGVIWRELNSVLTPEFLPHQVIPGDVDARNDTLLVTANLAFYPKKRFLNFESIASLILHQFVNTIRTSSLFQRYGLVRMLIWTRSDDTLSFLPKTIQRRKRQALENDLLCEWIREVCGDETASGSWFAREDAINHASLATTIKKMRAAKLELPAGREPKDFLETLAAVKARKRILEPGKHAPTFKRPYQDVLASLYTADTEQGGLDKDSDDFKTMNIYRWRTTSDIKTASRLLQHSQHLDKIKALHKSKKTSAKRKAAAELKWETEMREVSKVILDQFITYKDNLHAFRQTPPLLEWDRRDYEPMTVQAQEFFPNVHCSLLDIQPRAPHPLMRQMGPNSNRAADMFDLILGSLTQQLTQPLGPNLDSLWPGAADFILPAMDKHPDVSRGGFLPNLSYAEPSPRLLSARQLEQLLELWMEWPFRPEFNELVGRTQDDLDDRFDDSQHIEI